MKHLCATCLLLGVILQAAAPRASAQSDPENRFMWNVCRLREVSTVENKLRQSQKIALLKLDTVTGKVWQYSPESLTVDADGVKGEFGHFQSIHVEGLQEPPAPGKDQKPPDDQKKPPAPRANRFAFITIGVPRTVLNVLGETAGVVEREELFLTDRHTGHNWVFEARVEVSKKDDAEVRIVKNRFTRIFNADELAVVGGEPKEGPKEDAAYKFKRSLAELKELYMNYRTGKTLQPDSKDKIDCVLVLSKDDNTPMVVMSRKLRNTKAVGVTPWQVELYSDRAVEYLCGEAPVDFDKADCYLIFMNSSSRTARGFNGLSAQTVRNMPDYDKAGKLIRTE